MENGLMCDDSPTEDWATDFDHLSREWTENPFPIWADLRQKCPVAHTDRYGGVYLPTRYQDISDAAYDHDQFTSRTIVVRSTPLLKPFPAPPMNATGEHHRQSRKKLIPAFTRTKVEAYRAAVESLAAELALKASRQKKLDIISAYARALAVRSVMRVVGAPVEDADLLGHWTSNVLIFGINDPVAVDEAADEMADYCKRLALRRAGEPREDIASVLMKDWDGQDQDLLYEAAVTLRLLLLAGVDTTASVLGGALWHLATHTSDRLALASNLELMPGAVEEFLRVFAPTTMAREIKADTVLAGTALQAGQLLMLPYPAANRDPEVFMEPDRIDMARSPNKHLAFGIGIHRCVGDHLARMIIGTGLRVWLQSFPNYTLDEQPQMDWSVGTVRGLSRLYVRTGKGAVSEIKRAATGVSVTTKPTRKPAATKISSKGAAFLQRARIAEAAGSLDDAWRCVRSTLQSDPQHVATILLAGNIAWKLGRGPVAKTYFQQAAGLAPEYYLPLQNLGVIAFNSSQLDVAFGYAKAAARLAPEVPDVHKFLASVLFRLGRTAEGLRHITRASELKPNDTGYLTEAMLQKRQVCDWRGFEEDERRLRDFAAAGNLVAPIALMATQANNAEQHACARTWARTFASPQAARFPARHPKANQPWRIGYISGDFHDHATSRLVAELIESHDRSCFTIYGYSYGPDKPSAMRDRISNAFDVFRDIKNTSSAAAARRIYDDAVDVLVDMKGYTSGARTEILAWRPAPIQVNYLGFPGTMGSKLIDYVITDSIVSPPEFEVHSTERFAYLPHCFQPNDTLRPQPDGSLTRARYGIPDDVFVYCCFNAAYKLTPAVFDRWMRILTAVPRSVLWLMVRSQEQAEHLTREAKLRHVDPRRLLFVRHAEMQEHLGRCAISDLFLDTLPVSAFTTASDALWAGLPVLTCAGETPAGRGSASLLTAIGVPELVTTDLAGYEETAIRLARDPDTLKGLRSRIETGRQGRPPFDTVGLARNLEHVYERMIRRTI